MGVLPKMTFASSIMHTQHVTYCPGVHSGRVCGRSNLLKGNSLFLNKQPHLPADQMNKYGQMCTVDILGLRPTGF